MRARYFQTFCTFQFIVLSVLLSPFSFAADGNELPINYQEEQDVGLSRCEEVSISASDVRLLGDEVSRNRVVAQRRITVALLTAVLGNASEGYCLKEKAARLIQSFRLSADTQAPDDVRAEILRRLEKIDFEISESFQMANSARFRSIEWLDTDLVRPDDYVAAYKTVHEWKMNGCNITGVSCSILNNFESSPVYSYLGSRPLYGCRVSSDNCTRAEPIISEENSETEYLCKAGSLLRTEIFAWGEPIHYCFRENGSAPQGGACSESDTDGDGTGDESDLCPLDVNKTALQSCGCNYSENDSDGDGAPDCIDYCPNDSSSSEAEFCGCSTGNLDSDADGTRDCDDQCPSDPAKIESLLCGCGVSEADSDGDGRLDCEDGCPADSAKTEGLACGCGISDDDTDSDGTADCNDQCPADYSKLFPGTCGCGIPDIQDACGLCPDHPAYNMDADGDGTLDCQDGCPLDEGKIAPGSCGCGTADADSDNDAVLDCQEDCDWDPEKRSSGLCGCGVVDSDTDGDGILDCGDISGNGIGELCDASGDAAGSSPGQGIDLTQTSLQDLITQLGDDLFAKREAAHRELRRRLDLASSLEDTYNALKVRADDALLERRRRIGLLLSYAAEITDWTSYLLAIQNALPKTQHMTSLAALYHGLDSKLLKALAERSELANAISTKFLSLPDLPEVEFLAATAEYQTLLRQMLDHVAAEFAGLQGLQNIVAQPIVPGQAPGIRFRFNNSEFRIAIFTDATGKLRTGSLSGNSQIGIPVSYNATHFFTRPQRIRYFPQNVEGLPDSTISFELIFWNIDGQIQFSAASSTLEQLKNHLLSQAPNEATRYDIAQGFDAAPVELRELRFVIVRH